MIKAGAVTFDLQNQNAHQQQHLS
ncbi:hypothetical protein CGLO_18132 [Colletotrichum gloeosporioides Cg-14]|uniref:Uncharacterized protein n=1 Tax=Colletotrichum gloeosporioides (strain Cg-14) TaxID=1237896 RepID=T0JV30_COLGC|nr:hypothetical protein CGLO_18132 [Colletotrichum gloeosporioides Cg-14]